MSDVSVCILAYNEQKHIAGTIRAIVAGTGDLDFDVVVYANGCTDQTAAVVQGLCRTIPNLELRELPQPCKPAAWNTAFAESASPVIIFSDGDVRPEPGSVAALQLHLLQNPQLTLVSAQLWPDLHGASLEQRLTGFLQIPLAQDFLAGGFYAVRRSHLAARLAEQGLSRIPDGIVGEDEFLEAIVPRDAFAIAPEKVLYEPSTLADYWKYLARMRWQEEQRLRLYGDRILNRTPAAERINGARLSSKLTCSHGLLRTLLGLSSAGLRTVVKSVFRAKIDQCYCKLGPVCCEGQCVLGQDTRSDSAK